MITREKSDEDTKIAGMMGSIQATFNEATQKGGPEPMLNLSNQSKGMTEPAMKGRKETHYKPV